MRVCHVTVHGIGTPPRPLDPGEDRTWVSVEQLEALLDAAVGRPHVRLTFDDANASDAEIALPRLLERDLRATFFVLPGLLGEPGRLDEGDVRDLHRSGMTIGSHGWSHRNWRTLAGGRSDAATHEELVLAPRSLARLVGAEVSDVAVPFGAYDRHVLSLLRQVGATRVFTSDSGWARPGSWIQPRNSIHADSDLGWGERVMARPPRLASRARTAAARAAKRVRGRA